METSYKKAMAEQESKIKKYEQKMRDLIEAYKTLSKEKEALESTVKSLTMKNDNSSAASSDESENNKAMNQVVTLSNAIATLSEEKRKMEKKYVEDKKVTRGEYESKLAALRSELDSMSITISQLNGQLSESRSQGSKSLEQSQQQLHTVEKERNILREQLNEVSAALHRKEDLLLRLNEDNNYFRSMGNDLQQEMTSMKNGYECRIALLEETIADLSKTIGQMEQQRQSDQDMLMKLSEKLKNNVSDFRELLIRKESQSDTPDILQFQDSDKIFTSSNVDSIVEKMSQLRLQLQKLDPNVDIVSIMGRDSMPLLVECSGDCQSKISQLKEELECSQLAMQEFIKMNCAVLPGSYQQQVIDRLNNELAVSKLKISELQDELSNLDVTSTRNVKNLKDVNLKTEWRHKQEILKLQQEFNQTILDLQSELTKHRNRTIDLLSEKDAEIKSLQKLIPINKLPDCDSQDHEDHDEDHDNDLHVMRNINSCPLYQCCEMKARMDQELKSLRHNKRQLMIQIHKLESEIEYIKSDWKNEVNTLTVRAQRAESINKLSSGINMEYLRNVLFRFLSTSDPSCKYLMAKAIGKVLQFSTEEISSLQENNLM